MILGYIVELLTPTLEGKVFWDNTQFVGMFAAPIFALFFVLSYTGRMSPRLWRLAGGLVIIPILSLILVFTDRFHGLVRAESARLIASRSFPALTYDFTLTFILMVVYATLPILATVSLLLFETTHARPPFRLQNIILTLGFLTPLIITLLPVFGLEVASHRDLTPVGFAIGNIIVAVGLFQYGLFDLVPVAHERIVASMIDGIMVMDNRGYVVDLNTNLQAYLGQEPNDAIGAHVLDLFPEHRDLAERILNVNRLNTQITFEENGEQHYGALTLSTLHDQRGIPWGRVVVIRDITERVAAETALRASEARLAKAEALAQVGSWEWDLETDAITLSKGWQRIHGCVETELTRNALMHIAHPDDRQKIRRAFERALTDGSLYDIEHRVIRQDDGEVRIIQAYGEVVRNADGTPIKMYGAAQDITEHKRAQRALQEARDELEQRVKARTSELQQANEQLQESESRFRLLAENARDIVYRFRFRPEPGFDYVSPSAETVVGIQPEALYENPKRLLAIVHPEDREFLHALLQSRAKVGDANFTLRWMQDDGSVVWTEHSRTLITDDKGEVVAEEDIARDVTEQVQATEALRRAHEQLQALSRNLVEVQEAERAYIARELHDEAGQALSYQLLTLGMLERNADDREAVATRAQEAVQIGEALMENLRRMALRLRPTALDHLGLTPALEQYVQGLSAQRRFNIQLATLGMDEERLPPEMETALYRIIQEALTNVIRHAEATQVDVLVERRGGDAGVIALIEDDGVGFNPQATDTDAHLGLVGMRERVEMLDGTLTIESEPGKGTTVLVEVPYDTTD
jgi:PAS domain S-box-containing protein